MIMSNTKRHILIVDDDDGLRSTLVYLFAECGFVVSHASDGFGALEQMRSALPDILISDLNMPAMCGFELLSIVRRRFPSIGVIAMSGAYPDESVPPGVAADAFYPKGSTSIGSLFRIVNVLAGRGSSPRNRSAVPVWIHRFALDSHPEGSHLVWCPECLRMFSCRAVPYVSPLNSASCPHCASEIQFALLDFPNVQQPHHLQQRAAY
jgi:CheY-like chemotaxis protein